MDTNIVQQLRRAIDAKHKDALEALKTIQEYLEEPVPSPKGGKKKSKTKRKPPSRAGTGKIRPAVLAVMAKGFLPIQAVADRTKLTPLQIRGVVLAPALKDDFTKKEVGGTLHYKYEGKLKD